MADAVRWLVTFSSPYHLAWFLLSTFVLALALALRSARFGAWACVGHGIVAIEAALVLLFRDGGEVFSVHCIWFNGLMAVAHWLVMERRIARGGEG